MSGNQGSEEREALRDRPKPFDLAELPSVAEARAMFLQALPPWTPPVEEIALTAGLGRVLGEDVVAEVDVPAFPRSAVDGFAVKSEDLAGASPQSPVRLALVGRVAMGEEARRPLERGHAQQIATGGMLPPGADAALPVEQTQPAPDGAVAVLQPVAAGDNVVPRGADIAAGTRLLSGGHRLRPADLGALAGLGRLRLRVYRRVEVAILSTGDELVAPEREPHPGQIRDMNTYSLAAAVRADGAVPRILGIAPDDARRLRAALREALASDIVVVSGATSVGTDDVMRELFDELGPPGVVVHGVRLAPGKPTILAVVQGRPAFGLPGNPVSALVAYDLFVRPVLRLRMGWGTADPWQGSVRARLARAARRPRGREMRLRVALRLEGDEVVAHPVPGGSTLLTTLVKADGIVTIPLEREGLEAGEWVDVTLGPLW